MRMKWAYIILLYYYGRQVHRWWFATNTYIIHSPKTFTSSVSNAFIILVRHVSTTDVCSSLGDDDDIHRRVVSSDDLVWWWMSDDDDDCCCWRWTLPIDVLCCIDADANLLLMLLRVMVWVNDLTNIILMFSSSNDRRIRELVVLVVDFMVNLRRSHHKDATWELKVLFRFLSGGNQNLRDEPCQICRSSLAYYNGIIRYNSRPKSVSGQIFSVDSISGKYLIIF